MKAPIVIGRDHLDCGSVASPNRETEAMKDGSDAIADWAILNALVNTAAGASWVSFHHGGGVGMGMSLHAGMVVVADGTPEAARAARARAHERSGHGRHPPRRRGVRRGHRLRREARRARSSPSCESERITADRDAPPVGVAEVERVRGLGLDRDARERHAVAGRGVVERERQRAPCCRGGTPGSPAAARSSISTAPPASSHTLPRAVVAPHDRQAQSVRVEALEPRQVGGAHRDVVDPHAAMLMPA